MTSREWVEKCYPEEVQQLLADKETEIAVLRKLVERLELKTTHQQAQLAEIKRALSRV